MAPSIHLHPDVARLARGIVRGRGFGLHVLVCDDPVAASALREQVAAVVAEDLRGSLSAMLLDPYLHAGPVSRESLIERLLRPLLADNHPDHPAQWRDSQRRVAWLDGSWAPARDHTAWYQCFGRLNEMRNDVVAHLDGALVLLLTPALYRGFATHAPDAWSIRRAVVHVELADDDRWLSFDRDDGPWNREEVLGRIEQLPPTEVVNFIDRLGLPRELGDRHGNREAQARALWDELDAEKQRIAATLLRVPPPGTSRPLLPGPVHLLHIDSPGISTANWRERQDQLRELLQQLSATQRDSTIDIVCISGSLTASASREEYQLLEEHILPMLTHGLQIPLERIVTAPRAGLSDEALAEYRAFERRCFAARIDPTRPGMRRYRIRGARVDVVTLTPTPSANGDGSWAMGRAQLARARRAVAGAELRVALVPECIAVLPAQERAFCAYAFDVVAHGVWRPEYGTLTRSTFGNQARARGVVEGVPFVSADHASDHASDGAIVGALFVHIARHRTISWTALRSARLDGFHDLSTAAKTLLPLSAYHALLEQGDAHNAAIAAVAALSAGNNGDNNDDNNGEHDAERRILDLNLLFECVRLTLWDECQHPITVDRRERVIEVLRTALDQLDLAPLPHFQAILGASLRAAMAQLIRDPDRLADAQSQAQTLGGVWQPESLTDTVAPGASIADIQRALEPKPGDTHPWRARLYIVEALSQAGHQEAAWTAITTLAREFPGRPLIAQLAHDIAISHNRSAEALPYARDAFHGWPGVGQRVALIGCLGSLGQFDEAWGLAQPLLAGERLALEHLRIVARVATECAQDRAASLWQSYMQRAPGRSPQRVRYARLLFELGHHAQASDQAWQAIERDTDERLSLTEIVTCAKLLGHPAEVAPITRERILRIAERLRTRFVGDARAEYYRLLLYLAIDDHERLASIDLPLLEEHGFAYMDGSQVLASSALQEHQRTAEATAAMYERGLVPLATFCRQHATPVSEYVVRVLRGEAFFGLCEPWLKRRDDAIVTSGEVLVGTLELLLLHELELLDALARGVRAQSARLILLRDDHQAMLAESLQFRHRPPVSEIARVQRLLEHDTGQDEQTRSLLELELHTWQLRIEAAERLDTVQKFVGRGVEAGWIQLIATPQLPSLLPAAPDDGIYRFVRESVHAQLSWYGALQEQPRRVMVSADSGIHASRNVLTPMKSLPWAPDDLRTAVEHVFAAQSQVVSFVHLVTRICPPDAQAQTMKHLAALGVVGAAQPQQIADWLCANDDVATAQLDSMEAIARQSGHWAQRRASNALTQPYGVALSGLWLTHAWPVEGDLDSVVQKLHAATHRGLERLESLDPTGSGAYLEQGLAWLFTAASNAAGRWWMPASSEIAHSDAEPAAPSTVVGDLVHEAIVSWACNDYSRLGACTVALQQNLLMVDELAHRKSLPSPPQEQLELLQWDWAGPSLGSEDIIWLTGGHLEPWLILSACWDDASLVEQMPLSPENASPIPVGAILSAGVAAFERGDITYEQHLYTIMWERPGQAPLRVEFPPEALILRADLKNQERLIHLLATSYRTFDGVLHHSLRQLKEAPGDPELRRRFAREAVAAPWRHILHEPSALLRWGDPAPDVNIFVEERTSPRTLDDLRALLSEPGPLREIRLDAELNERCKSGGPWESGGLPLARLASELPTPMAMWPLRALLRAPGMDARLRDEMRDPPDELSTGQVVRTLSVALMAPGQFPSVLEHLPGYIEALLKQLETDPEPASLAAAEPGLLCLCRQVIERLAGNDDVDEPVTRPATRRDKVWLTYRLYGWLLLIMQRLAEDSAKDVVAGLLRCAPEPGSLRALRPPATDAEPPDILDPIEFSQYSRDSRWAHRRLAILNALLHGTVLREPWTRTLDGTDPSREQLTALFSEATLDHLRSWSERSLTEYERTVRHLEHAASTLLWSGPTTVPDTALVLLLWHDLHHFAALPREVRLRWIEQIPASIDDRSGPPPLTLFYLLRASAICIERLSPPEQTLLARKLDSASLPAWLDSPALAALLSLSHLGHDFADASLSQRLVANLGTDDSSMLVVMYANASSTRGLEPESVAEQLGRIFDAARERDDVDEVSLYRAVAAQRQGDSLREILDAVANARPWLQSDHREDATS